MLVYFMVKLCFQEVEATIITKGAKLTVYYNLKWNKVRELQNQILVSENIIIFIIIPH